MTDHHRDWEKIASVIINSSAARLLGISDSEEAIGQRVSFWDREWTIIGVTPDFHEQGLKRQMEPIVMFPVYSTYSNTSVKVLPENMMETIAGIERTYKEHFPNDAFEYPSMSLEARHSSPDR